MRPDTCLAGTALPLAARFLDPAAAARPLLPGLVSGATATRLMVLIQHRRMAFRRAAETGVRLHCDPTAGRRVLVDTALPEVRRTGAFTNCASGRLPPPDWLQTKR